MFMKGYLIGLGLAGLLGVSLAMGVGCSSSSSGGGTPSGTYCDVTTAGVEECTGISGGDSDSTSQFTSACTMSGGKVVSSCPTANALGCCTISGSNGASASSCTYCPSVETQMGAQMACTSGMGMWTAGSESACSTGDSGTSSGGGDSGTSSGGGDSGTAGD
jgi:hypothetical protein